MAYQNVTANDIRQYVDECIQAEQGFAMHTDFIAQENNRFLRLVTKAFKAKNGIDRMVNAECVPEKRRILVPTDNGTVTVVMTPFEVAFCGAIRTDYSQVGSGGSPRSVNHIYATEADRKVVEWVLGHLH